MFKYYSPMPFHDTDIVGHSRKVKIYNLAFKHIPCILYEYANSCKDTNISPFTIEELGLNKMCTLYPRD